jgi:colanic acid/amylovoran biosynthesis protein
VFLICKEVKTKNITIELYGTGTHNRGAELMADATAEMLRANFPDIRIVVSPYFGTSFERASHGFHTTWEPRGRAQRLFVPLVFRLIPTRLLDALGIVNPREIDVVVDASGFAFSDQWGPGPAVRLVRKMNSTSFREAQLILLPQAFGPFRNRLVKEAMTRLLRRSSIVFARDTSSHRYLSELTLKTNVSCSPDFTIGLAPLPWPGNSLPGSYTLLVPNCRMLDKGANGKVYLNLIKKIYEMLENRGWNPFFLLHDKSEDQRVIEQVSDSPKVLSHDDPRVLKGLLGGADFVLGSRFHALVSALSQGVPCIGVGWSHKYPELFSDFGVPELCPAEVSNELEFERLVEKLMKEDYRTSASLRIKKSSEVLKKKNRAMWEQVSEKIKESVS